MLKIDQIWLVRSALLENDLMRLVPSSDLQPLPGELSIHSTSWILEPTGLMPVPWLTWSHNVTKLTRVEDRHDLLLDGPA